jgi:hypothetical protein
MLPLAVTLLAAAGILPLVRAHFTKLTWEALRAECMKLSVAISSPIYGRNSPAECLYPGLYCSRRGYIKQLIAVYEVLLCVATMNFHLSLVSTSDLVGAIGHHITLGSDLPPNLQARHGSGDHQRAR